MEIRFWMGPGDAWTRKLVQTLSKTYLGYSRERLQLGFEQILCSKLPQTLSNIQNPILNQRTARPMARNLPTPRGEHKYGRRTSPKFATLRSPRFRVVRRHVCMSSTFRPKTATKQPPYLHTPAKNCHITARTSSDSHPKTAT